MFIWFNLNGDIMIYYLDLSIGLLILNGLLSIYITSHIIYREFKWYIYLILVFFYPFEILIIYGNILYLGIFLIIEFLLFKVLFRKDLIKVFLISNLFKTIFSFILILLIPSIKLKYLTLYIVDSSSNYIFFLYPICFLMTYLITIYVDKVFRLVKFKEKVMLIIDKDKYIFNAYMDSGNLLTKDRIPVIFISKNANSIKRYNVDENIIVKTINGEKTYLGHKCLIRLFSKKEYTFCYICLSDETDFYGCDILLNGLLL